MHRVSLSYRGGDATQSRNGQAREGDQAEDDAESQASAVRDTVVISHAAWAFRPIAERVALDELVAPLPPQDEGLFRLVEAVTALFFGERLPVLTPGALLRAPVPNGTEASGAPGVGLIYQRYNAYRAKDEHVTFIPTIMKPAGEAVAPTVVEVRLDTELMRSMDVTPEHAEWDMEYGLSLDVPPGGWAPDAAHVTVRMDVDGVEDQVGLLVEPSPTDAAHQGEMHPLEPAGPELGGRAAGARRVRVWTRVQGGPDRLVALGVPGFGLVYVGAL